MPEGSQHFSIELPNIVEAPQVSQAPPVLQTTTTTVQTTTTKNVQSSNEVWMKTFQRVFQEKEMRQEADFFGTQTKINPKVSMYISSINFIKTMVLYIQQLMESSQRDVEEVKKRLLVEGQDPQQIFIDQQMLGYTSEIAKITVEEYLLGFLKFSLVSSDSFIYMLIVLKRYSALYKEDGIDLGLNNIFRYILSALRIINKLNDDFFNNNKHTAKVGRVCLQEMNQLEINFLGVIFEQGFVFPDVFIHYQLKLLNLALSQQLIDPLAYQKQIEQLCRCYHAYLILKNIPVDEESYPRIGEAEMSQLQINEIDKFQKLVGWECFVSASRLAEFRQFNFELMFLKLHHVEDVPTPLSNDFNPFHKTLDIESKISIAMLRTLKKAYREPSKIEPDEVYEAPITYTSKDIKLNKLANIYCLSELWGTIGHHINDKIKDRNFPVQTPSLLFLKCWGLYFVQVITECSNKNIQTAINELPEIEEILENQQIKKTRDEGDIAFIKERGTYQKKLLIHSINRCLDYLFRKTFISSSALLGMHVLLSYYTEANPLWLMEQRTIYYTVLASFLVVTKALDPFLLKDEYIAKLFGIEISDIEEMQRDFAVKTNLIIPDNLFKQIDIKKWENNFLDKKAYAIITRFPYVNKLNRSTFFTVANSAIVLAKAPHDNKSSPCVIS